VLPGAGAPFATVQAARADGAFVRGWFPPIVPENSIEIWEFHDLDNSATWACFRVPDGPAATEAMLTASGALRFIAGGAEIDADGPAR